MKEFFRFLRGELNGFYLQALNTVHVLMSEEWKKYMEYFNFQQFEEGKIDVDFLSGIGIFAGIFLPRLTVAESKTAMRMSDSHEENGTEVSERGLFDTEYENFDFSHAESAGDINDYATPDLRSSMVGNEAVLGYISSQSTDVLDEEGNVKPEVILDTPPVNVAYTDFYGNQFMLLAEGEKTYEKMDSKLLLELFKSMQRARYNGMTLTCLTDIIKTICPENMVKIISIQWSGLICYVNIIIDFENEVTLKQQRLGLLEFVLKLKYPNLELNEINE